MSPRNMIALTLTAFSFALLIPGLLKPILHLKANTAVSAQMIEFHATVLDRNRSILGTAYDLHQHNNSLVAALIILFCVVVPLAKGCLLIFGLFKKDERLKQLVSQVLHALGKWSMADVFLVAILLTFLATTGQSDRMRQNLEVLGMRIPVELGLELETKLGPGFWWFLSYCLISLAAIQLADWRTKPSA